MVKINENIYNVDYINKHTLSIKKIREAGIELLGIDEVFVQYPGWRDYYGSNYGRLISLKCGKIELRQARSCGLSDGKDQYLGYRMTKVTYGKRRELSITCHRLVADIFLPNFWKDTITDRNKLQAHHLDHSKSNNYYKNIILLPTRLHKTMNTVKKTVLLKSNGTFRIVTPYQIMEETGLTLDEIILSANGKPIKSEGKYSIFEAKGHLIGFQFTPKKKKKKNSKKK